MPQPRIFLDTSLLFPSFAVHDRDHERVSRVFEAHEKHFRTGALVTTNHVIFEAISPPPAEMRQRSRELTGKLPLFHLRGKDLRSPHQPS
jgi:predicted nucleic acid-binding protein